MNRNRGIAAVVVIYNPDKSVEDNIMTYVSEVDKLYVIDNTPQQMEKNNFIIPKYDNLEYFALNENKGIAYALNKGVELAEEDGFDYLLTMDQDSCFKSYNLGRYVKEAMKLYENDKNIAIIGISHDAYKIRYPNKEWEYARNVITSGMIISLIASKSLGKFREDFFIDFVDYEYCYRAWDSGYKVIVITNCKLTHQVGGMHPIKFFGIHFNNHNAHNKIRIYYQFRNAITVMKLYPRIIPTCLMMYIKDWIKMICVERDAKNKFLYSLYGIRDGIFNHLGRIEVDNK